METEKTIQLLGLGIKDLLPEYLGLVGRAVGVAVVDLKKFMTSRLLLSVVDPPAAQV
jgi:hypothetical protein